MASFKDYLNSVVNYFKPAIDYTKSVQANATPLQEILGGGNPLIGKFLTSIPSDAANVAGGVLNTAKSAAQDIQNKGVGAVADIPGAVVKMGEGFLSNINQDIGSPVTTDANGNLKVGLPNPEKALENITTHPVKTALDITAVKGFLPGSEGAEAGATAGEAGTEATAPVKVPSADEIPDQAAKSFMKDYTIPTKRAGSNDLNVMGTSKEILSHVKSGMSLDNVAGSPDLVTGDTGIITKMTRNALGNIKGEVSIGTPISDAENLIKQSGSLIPEDTATKIIEDIKRDVNETPEEQWQKPNIGYQDLNQPTSLKPLDAFDKARNLEDMAAKYARQNTYLTPNMTAVDISKVYSGAADSILDEVDKVAKGQNVLDTVKTPENMATLKSISPRLAQQVQNAQDIGELRSTAAPFVRLSKMQELTDNAANSAAMKVAGAATGGLHAGPATMIGAGTLGLPGMVGGNMIDRAMSPIYENIMAGPQKWLNNTVTKATLNGGIPGVSSLVSGMGKIAPAAISSLGENNQLPSPTANGLPAIGGVGTSTTNVQDPYSSGLAMRDQDYKTQRAAIIAEQGVYANQVDPTKAAALDAQLKTLDSNYSIGKPLSDAYKVRTSVSTLIDEAKKELQDPSIINILQLNPSYQQLNQAANGKYSKLANILQTIESTVPNFPKGGLFNAKTTDTALQDLNSAQNIVDTQYNSVLNQFTSGQGQTNNANATANPTAGLPSPTVNGLPPITPSGGGTVQAITPNAYAQPSMTGF